MKDTIKLEDVSVTTFAPEHSEWKCYLFGNTPMRGNGLVWVPSKGCEPNLFWRKMQWLILGNRWIKEK